MTDLEAFVALYKRFGIDIIIVDGGDKQFIILGDCPCDAGQDEYTDSDKFVGYHGFYSRLAFDAAGKFISQGFYE